MYFLAKFEHNFYMFKLCIFFIFECLIFLIMIKIIKRKNEDKNKTICFKLLADYISQKNKKRKSVNSNSEIPHKQCNLSRKMQNINNYCSRQEIIYKKLESSFLCYETKNLIQKKQTYAERINNNFSKAISKLSNAIDTKINNSNQKYRSINNECIIETVASSFARATLTEEQFDMFASFKNLSALVKVYKKEAEILSFLVIKNLIEIYVVLQNEIFKIKKQVLKSRHIKRLKRNASPATIYGTFLFNKSASKILLKSKHDIEQATSIVISELDTICYKQKIIFRYIELLQKTIWNLMVFFSVKYIIFKMSKRFYM